MHVNYRMQVEIGIGGLKRKWQQLMKRFDCTKPKCNQLFCSCALMTNFLHKQRIDFTEFINDRVKAYALRGWDGNH